jgi:hypothetical protein
VRNPVNIATLPPAMRKAIRTFRDSPSIQVWRRFGPDSTGEEIEQTYGYECDAVARDFASALSAQRLRNVALVQGDDHWWTRVTIPDGRVVNVDWTARQFHNLERPPSPRHANLPCPLVWLTGEQFPEDTHPVTGPGPQAATVTVVAPCAYCHLLMEASGAVGDTLRGWDWPGRGHVVACKKCAGIVRCSHGREWDAGEYDRAPVTCPDHQDESSVYGPAPDCAIPGAGHDPGTDTKPGAHKRCVHCEHLLLWDSKLGAWVTVHQGFEPCHCTELVAMAASGTTQHPV